MKIQSVIPNRNFNIYKSASFAFNFKSNIVRGDYFEPSVKNLYKIAKIEDLEGRVVYAPIIRQDPEIPRGGNAKEFLIKTNKDILGRAIVLDYPRYKGLFLSDLNTEEDSERHYKGAGSELLKCCVEESRKKGKEGKITCCAFHNEKPPFAFYYKNNFLIAKNDDNLVSQPTLYNAPLQYIVKNNLAVSEILPMDYNLFYMELDKESSSAFMRGERLYEDRICDEIALKDIEGCQYSAQFIEVPKGEYYIQMLNEEAESQKLAFIAKLKIHENLNGEKRFTLGPIVNDFLDSCPELEVWAYELLDDLAKQYL